MISDGGPADKGSDGALSLLDTSRWYPCLPGQDLTFLGVDGRDVWQLDPEMPITLALFGSAPQDLRNISGIAVRFEEEFWSHMWEVEVSYPPGTTPLRLGVGGVEAGRVHRFAINCANGEYIRGIKAIYRLRGEFFGFKVRSKPPL